MKSILNPQIQKCLRILIPFVLIPIIAYFGGTVFDKKRYLFFSLLTAVLALFLFYCGIEKKQIGTRRMVLTAVMTALSVAGRFLPFFKPVTAITVLTAIYLGGEAGFLVGSMSALLSNLYFGQGPWTPFQMLSWGMIGLCAGYLAKPLQKKPFLLLYGVLSGIVYSMIMDVWTVLWYNNSFDFSLYLAALSTAIPYTILYSVSNFFFLYLMAKPIGDKLKRIKIKYGV